ncbi:uncharacterized protein [Ptychodera flava]|uniref:uncharacterized protein isoform X2 n=1 Tax=Ptychodera flava TaxID=63121 RepID=UPI00396A2578
MRFATAVVLAAACLVAVQAVNQEKKEEIKRKKITALQQKKDHLVMEKKKEEERMQKKMAALREVKHLAVKTRIETPVEKKKATEMVAKNKRKEEKGRMERRLDALRAAKAKMHSTGEAGVGVPKERKDAETTEMKRKLVPHVGSLLRNLKDAMFDDQTEHITDEKYLSLKEKISAELRKTAVEIEGKRKELKKAKAILDNDEQTMTEGKAAKRNKQTRHKNPEKHASTLLEEKLRQLKRKKATNAKAEKLLAQAAKKKKAMKVVEKTKRTRKVNSSIIQKRKELKNNVVDSRIASKQLSSADCGYDDFICANGNCIPWYWECDFLDDCGDNSDEVSCESSSEYSLWSESEGSGSDGYGCNYDEVACPNGYCIPHSWLCDNWDDCGDNSDEEYCDSYVSSETGCHEFQCYNGHCIPFAWECDNWDDCGDYSDEQHCQLSYVSSSEAGCGGDEFQCMNGMCIPDHWECDNMDDCGDNSDEQDCGCNSDQFTCADGLCIPDTWQCDKWNDCGDNSDEDGCGCADDEFTCSNGECVPGSWECDHWDDCGDNSDEVHCGCAVDEFTCNSGGCIPGSWGVTKWMIVVTTPTNGIVDAAKMNLRVLQVVVFLVTGNAMKWMTVPTVPMSRIVVVEMMSTSVQVECVFLVHGNVTSLMIAMTTPMKNIVVVAIQMILSATMACA